MFTSPKYEALQIEEHVFQRLRDHAEEFDYRKPADIFGDILAVIAVEKEQACFEMWKQAQKFM